MEKRRVVVTGIGAVSPYGIGAKTLWDSIISGKSAVSTIENISLEGHSVHIGGEIKNFDETQFLEPKEAKKLDRYIHFAVAEQMKP